MMIRFEQGDACFNYRIVGVALRDDAILLQQAEGDEFRTLPDGCKYLELDSFQSIEESGVRLTFRWFARQPEALSTLPLLPSFLRGSLAELPATVLHVVHYDE